MLYATVNGGDKTSRCLTTLQQPFAVLMSVLLPVISPCYRLQLLQRASPAETGPNRISLYVQSQVNYITVQESADANITSKCKQHSSVCK